MSQTIGTTSSLSPLFVGDLAKEIMSSGPNNIEQVGDSMLLTSEMNDKCMLENDAILACLGRSRSFR